MGNEFFIFIHTTSLCDLNFSEFVIKFTSKETIKELIIGSNSCFLRNFSFSFGILRNISSKIFS